MKSPEHLKSVVVDPESGDNLESQIKSLKKVGRECIANIQEMISKGESITDPDETLSIRIQIEARMREALRIRRKIRVLIGEETESSFTPEQYLTDLHPFMLETYKDKWSYSAGQLKIVEKVISDFENIHIDQDILFDEMKSINSDEKRLELNKAKTGELYLNSESVDFETATPFIPDIPDKIKKLGVSGVMKYIHETYKETHILPDLRYYQYLAQLGDRYNGEKDLAKKESIFKQIPEQMKDGNWYYFPGSALVNESGHWMSPFLLWNGAGFFRLADGVEDGWGSGYRVVLLER